MEKLLLISHAIAGGAVLVLGLISFMNRKGSISHIAIGKTYVGFMWWICLSALIVISFYRFSFFLLVIAALTFYASFVGVRVIKRRGPRSTAWYDWLVSIVTFLFGTGLLLYGIKILLSNGGFHPLGLLSIGFGLFTMRPAFIDIRNYTSSKPDEKLWWLQQHIGAMGGSYIAAITAFAVQNNNIFMLGNYSWLTWVLPSLLLAPTLSIIKKRQLAKFGVREAELSS